MNCNKYLKKLKVSFSKYEYHQILSPDFHFLEIIRINRRTQKIELLDRYTWIDTPHHIVFKDIMRIKKISNIKELAGSFMNYYDYVRNALKQLDYLCEVHFGINHYFKYMMIKQVANKCSIYKAKLVCYTSLLYSQDSVKDAIRFNSYLTYELRKASKNNYKTIIDLCSNLTTSQNIDEIVLGKYYG